MSNETATLAALAAHQVLVDNADELLYGQDEPAMEEAQMAAAPRFEGDELAEMAAYEAAGAVMACPRLRVLDHFPPVFSAAMNAAAMHPSTDADERSTRGCGAAMRRSCSAAMQPSAGPR